jgi:hypothetical protein
MISAIEIPHTEPIWNFLQIMGHEIPLVLLLIARLKVRRFVVGRGGVGVKEFEGSEAVPGQFVHMGDSLDEGLHHCLRRGGEHQLLGRESATHTRKLFLTSPMVGALPF